MEARQILEGRENASRIGAEADWSTSTSMWSMSMSTKSCKRQLVKQAEWCSIAMVATAATVRMAAATRNQLKTSEAEASLSFGAPATTGVWCVRGRQAIYWLSTMVLAAKPCEHIAAAAAMTHSGTDGSIELFDSWWRLFNSITPLLPVDCSTCLEEAKQSTMCQKSLQNQTTQLTSLVVV